MSKLFLLQKIFVPLCLALAVFCCADDGPGSRDGTQNGDYTAMEGPVADCQYDLLTFQLPDGSLVEVSINGLLVEELAGSQPIDQTTVEGIRRRGVRFGRIFNRADISLDDNTPVNGLARDGWDPLRGPLQNDVTRLPTFGFLRDNGYVFVGSPGDKDPLYPEMENNSLIVDYDLTVDSQVPQNIGTTLASLNIHRWKMMEFYDQDQRGIIQLDPKVENN